MYHLDLAVCMNMPSLSRWVLGWEGRLLIHNKLYRGAYSLAGELGHMSIQMNGRKTEQGRGGLEQYVGNRRITERTIRLLKQNTDSVIHQLVGGDLSALTPHVVALAAEQGDKLAKDVFDFVADCLATAFAAVTYLIQPQVFIVGGGVAQSGDLLFKPLRRHLAERLSPPVCRANQSEAGQAGKRCRCDRLCYLGVACPSLSFAV